MKNADIVALPAGPKPGDSGKATDKNQKPYPCLLTRVELQAIIAKQLG
ncbi:MULTISPECIES: hypothetical protein [Rhizobium]|uniref:Uncharacterized protein n=1 Tax=Rhizobium metallidurans TaxID=1265931 RepID=A0A7W6GDE3_9HYPH|nr:MULTISPECIES: hypothetical protein [Rhizobium]MBB3966985.1 hypothetical protein [Rhizobium metallidurans]